MKTIKPQRYKPYDPRKPKWAPKRDEEPTICNDIQANIRQLSRARANAGAQVSSLQESIAKRAPVIEALEAPLDHVRWPPPQHADPKLEPDGFARWLRPVLAGLRRAGIAGALVTLLEGARSSRDLQMAIKRLENYRDDLLARSERDQTTIQQLLRDVARLDDEINQEAERGRDCPNLSRSFISWPHRPKPK